MAQTIIAQPQAFTPAYNPVKYIIDSTNKNKDGFLYIFDVYSGATRIGRFKILPRITDGYGEEDLSKFLSSYVSWYFNPAVTQDKEALNCWFDYSVKIGEEYLYQVDYTSALTNSGTITRVNVSNSFSVGDQINIAQDDGGTANPLLEGLHTIVAVSGSWFEVNVAWTSITDVNVNGSVTYANKSKVVTYDITTITGKKVYNGAYTWVDFVTYNQNDYTLDGTTKQWLTNQPKTDFYCTLGQDLFLNAKVTEGKQIFFQNSDGETFTKDIVSHATISTIGVGCNNYGVLTPFAGTLPMIKPDTTFYEFWYYDGGIKSAKYRVDIDRRVQINEYHICFLDRQGSFSSFAFQLKSYERGEVTRDEFNKNVVGYVNGGQWRYNYEEFGFQTFNINVTKTLELNTNWMTQNMSDYFQQLITSPQTFLKLVQYVTTENGEPVLDENGCPYHVAESTAYVPCIVQTNSFEVFKQRNKNLIKQSIVVKLANLDNVNG